MITLKNLAVYSSGKSLVHETSIDLTSPMVVGLYGPNGSGKTSLLKAAANLIDTTHKEVVGEVFVDQISLRTLTAAEKAEKILYLGSDFQAPFRVTVREILELAKDANLKSKVNIAEVSEQFGIYSFLSRSFEELSDGEKQRIMIVRGVVQNPRWLCLDETFSKIDLDQSFLLASELKHCVEKFGMGIIFTAHDLNLISEFSDRLWLMKRGRLVYEGSVEDGLVTDHLQDLYPSRAIHVVRSPNSGKKKIIY